MRRFVFVCKADGFETPPVVPSGDPYRWPGLRMASIELAEHCFGAHDGGDSVAFERVWLDPPTGARLARASGGGEGL